MDIKTTMSTSQARKDLFSIIEGVGAGQRYTLTQNGYPKAVVLGAEEFESWVETLEIMDEFPDILEDLKKAKQDYKKGKYIGLEDLLKKYELQGRVGASSRKRVRKA